MKNLIESPEVAKDAKWWEIPAVNTHCHHLRRENFRDMTLHKLLQMTYVSWVFPDPGDTPEGRLQYFADMGSGSSFYWWKSAIERLYGDGRELSPESWEWFDARIARAYASEEHDINILRERCRYGSILLDDYNNPGDAHGLPGLMKPVFRCDMFLCGYAYGKTDENHNHAYDYFKERPCCLDDYVKEMAGAVERAKRKGAVGLKIAIAYERTIRFEPDTRKKAEEAFGNKEADGEQRKAFGDYIMFELAKIAAGLSMPIQIHTGLGILRESRAIGLRELIHANPGTRFDLFHGSYPWCDDILGLAYNYKNVYIDLCWLPLLSTSRAVGFLREALELTGTRRVLWGCDTWTSEESFGARMAAHFCIGRAAGEITAARSAAQGLASECAEKILHDNAADLYGL